MQETVCLERVTLGISSIRDDPNSEQFLLVSNDSEHCELEIEGNDIFSAVR